MLAACLQGDQEVIPDNLALFAGGE